MVKTIAHRVTAAGILLTVGIGTASAAEPIGEITRLQGAALVSQGARYVPASEGMSLRELDRVVLMEDSSATLTFADGCVREMGEQDLLTLTAGSTCKQPESTGTDALDNAAGNLGASPDAQTLETAATGQLGAAAGGVGAFGGAAAGTAAFVAVAGVGLIAAAADSSDNDTTVRRPLSPQ